MADRDFVLAIDQGTTSTRAMLFDREGRVAHLAQRELRQFYPADGWVEEDPEDIWTDTLAVAREVIERAGSADLIAAIGITNQRETTLLWDRRTGRPVHNAIVWQDRRTAEACGALRAAGHEELVRDRTGLVIDPYFSATKLRWLLDNVAEARAKAEGGALAFGTIDSFLLWRLTGGRVHATDATNAARTMLFNIEEGRWDETLLGLLEVPGAVLPQVLDNDAEFGETEPGLFGRAIPIRGMAGDQQAASLGQLCLAPGMTKSTYGTGCFALANTGRSPVRSRHRLLGTVAYRLGGETSYALEGAIFVAGAAVQWLRDGLRFFGHAHETETLAEEANPASRVYLVPAFTGLGAPYWDAGARGAILGLTRDAGIPEITRAALDAVCYQTRDLMEAMAADMGEGEGSRAPLRVDGGMVVNDWFLQRLADLLGRAVERPQVTETTAYGAALLAGKGAGFYPDFAELQGQWRRDRLFEPRMGADERDARYEGWKRAVARVRSEG